MNERNVEALHALLCACPEIQVDWDVLRDAAAWLASRGVLVPSAVRGQLPPYYGQLAADELERIAKGELEPPAS